YRVADVIAGGREPVDGGGQGAIGRVRGTIARPEAGLELVERQRQRGVRADAQRVVQRDAGGDHRGRHRIRRIHVRGVGEARLVRRPQRHHVPAGGRAAVVAAGRAKRGTAARLEVAVTGGREHAPFDQRARTRRLVDVVHGGAR